MFDGVHDQPHDHKELKAAARRAAMRLGACIDILVDLIDKMDDPDTLYFEDKKKAECFSGELIRLTAFVIRADAALEEMYSRIFLAKTRLSTDHYTYFEALTMMGYSEELIRMISDLRQFRNMVGHSLSLRKSLADKGMDKKFRSYLLYLKPAVRTMIKDARKIYIDTVEAVGGWEAFQELHRQIVIADRLRRKEKKRQLNREALSITEDFELTCADADTAFVQIYAMVRDDEKILEAPIGTVVETIRLLVSVASSLRHIGKTPTFNAVTAKMTTLASIYNLVRRTNLWHLPGYRVLEQTYGLNKETRKVRRQKSHLYRSLHLQTLRIVTAAVARAHSSEKDVVTA